MAPPLDASQSKEDLKYHYETYDRFVRWAAIFALHVLVILALLAYFMT